MEFVRCANHGCNRMLHTERDHRRLGGWYTMARCDTCEAQLRRRMRMPRCWCCGVNPSPQRRHLVCRGCVRRCKRLTAKEYHEYQLELAAAEQNYSEALRSYQLDPYWTRRYEPEPEYPTPPKHLIYFEFSPKHLIVADRISASALLRVTTEWVESDL